MIRTLTIAALLGLVTMSAQAQTTEAPATEAPTAAPLATEEQKAAIAAAIAANGCRVTPENNSAILAEAGLAETDAATVVEALLQAGTAQIENGELVLVSDGCPKP